MPTPNSAAIRPDGPARQDAVVRPNGAIRPDGAIRKDGPIRGELNPGDESASIAAQVADLAVQHQTEGITLGDGAVSGLPATPQRIVTTLPRSYAMPGRPSPETLGQMAHRQRIEGTTGLPDPANASGCTAHYIIDADASPGSGRTVQ